MEDRKRPNPYDHNDTSTPPTKKLITGPNGASKANHDADMPWKDDLERFQKDAIWRQMQEYRREKNTLEAQFKDMRKKARYHDDHLRVIDLWFKQLLDELRLLNPEEMDLSDDLSTIPTSLLFTDSQTFEQHLSERSREIRSLVARLFSRSGTSSEEVSQFQKRITHLLSTEKQHVLELEKYRAEKEELEGRLENASLRYMVAEKKLDRAKSVTVAKLEKQALLGAQKASTEEGGPVKREDSTANGVVENGDALAELEEAYNKTLAVSEKQKQQLEKLEASNLGLTNQLTELSAKVSRPSDEDFASTDLFKQLKSQHEDVIRKINHLEAINIQLREEAAKLQAERTSYRSQLESESQESITEKNALLSKAETDLARIRSNRDELLADLAMRKAAQDQERISMAKINELAAANEDRVRALEIENQRLKSQGGSETPTSIDLPSLSPGEFAAKYNDLEHKYNLLNSELVSMSAAFNKTSKVAVQKVSDLNVLEEKVLRLSAEKAKADQKYFAAMRDKEQRKVEVQTLRLQNTKSSDMVTQLKESEAAARTLLANLEKQLVETRDALNTKTTSHRTASQQIVENGILMDGLRAEIAELKRTIAAKDAFYATTASTCRQAELEAEEAKATLNDTKKSLESWKAKGLGDQSSEHEMLRTLAICTVCRKNFKDTAIKTCGHVFCKDCVEERLTSRSRKCPNCNKSFGSNDHMKVTL